LDDEYVIVPAVSQPAVHDIEKPEVELEGTVTPDGTVRIITPSVGMSFVVVTSKV